MLYLDCSVRTYVDDIVLCHVEEGPYSKSEFIRRALHTALNNENVFDELISQEYYVNKEIVEFLQSLLDDITKRKEELLEDNRRIYNEYSQMKVLEFNNKRYDEKTIDAINSIKAIKDRGCTVNMNMIKFNARKCSMSSKHFLKVLRREGVKI